MITKKLLSDYLEEYKRGMHPLEFLLDMLTKYCEGSSQLEPQVMPKITDMIGGMITEQINYSINEPDDIGKVIHKYAGNKFIELRQKVLDECNSCGKSKLIENGFCNCCGGRQ